MIKILHIIVEFRGLFFCYKFLYNQENIAQRKCRLGVKRCILTPKRHTDPGHVRGSAGLGVKLCKNFKVLVLFLDSRNPEGLTPKILASRG
jgi:hypothetical protein